MESTLVDKKYYKNQLLGVLPPDACGGIERYVKPVELRLGAIVRKAGGVLTHAWLPEGWVLPLLTVLESGFEIDCSNFGREGAFGLISATVSRNSFNRYAIELPDQ